VIRKRGFILNALKCISNLPSLVLERLRAQLNARGSSTVRALGRTFRALDSYDGNRKVDAQEFFVGLQENGVKLTKAECDVSQSQSSHSLT
jgi:hypothetical protein